MRLSSYPARPCLPSIKVVVPSSTSLFDLNRLSRYPARQASQAEPSPRPCWLSVLLSGHPPCGRLIASHSQSALLLSLTLPGPRTKYPRTFQVLSHFAFTFRWPPFASQFVDIVWRCDGAGAAPGAKAAGKPPPQRTPVTVLVPLCHVRALLWLLCLALVLAVPLCVCLRTTTCSPWTLEETSWCVRLARSSFNFAFSKPNAFNCLSPEQGCSSRRGGAGSKVPRDDPINYRGQSRELTKVFSLLEISY